MFTRFRKLPIILALFSTVGLIAACSTSGEDADSDSPLQVFAAASLNVAGDELKQAYAKAHSDQTIEWNFAGSSALVRQIEQGASADVFISADEKNMTKAFELPEFSEAKSKDDAPIVATNRLVLAVAEGNPGHVESLDDVDDAQVAICAESVPCGTLAHQVLRDHKLQPKNSSEDANVSDVSTRVATGQVDAGFIYSSDAQSLKESGTKIEVIDLAGVEKNKYPAATTNDAADNAADFVTWLESKEAQEILHKHGFGAGESARD